MAIQILLYVVAALLIVVGALGTILPVLPGPPLVFIGMLLAAWVDHFQHAGTFTLIVLGILTLLALAVDFIAGVLGARRVGASRLALFGAAIGTIVGIFFGLPGLLLGPFIGALIGELCAGGTVRKATDVGLGAWIGFVFGAVVKLALTFTMLGVFALAFLIG